MLSIDFTLYKCFKINTLFKFPSCPLFVFRNIGIIAYMLLTHTSPFVGEDNQETYLNISQVNVDYSEETFSSVSQLATDFVQSLLVKNPE